MSDRKTFIRQAGGVSALLLCGGMSLLLESCKTAAAASFELTEKQIKLTKKQADDSPTGLLVLRDDRLPWPVAVARIKENEYAAMPMICTHKGCELDAAGNRLVCPCHGSEFSPQGKVMSPPAEEDLPLLPLAVENDLILITFAR